MKNYNLFQCDLEKVSGNGCIKTTVFLPEKYAIEGKILELKIGVMWSNGWKVKAVHKNSKRSCDDLAKFERDYAHTREASDV